MEIQTIQPKKENKKWLKFVGGIIIVAFVLGGSYYYISGTPQYSLYKLKKSIENHNSEQFYKYVDVDTVISSLTNWAWKEVDQKIEKEKPEGEWGLLGYELGKGFVELLKPTIKEYLTATVKEAITTGFKEIEGEKEMEETFKKISYTDIKVQKDGKVANVEIPHFLNDGSSLKLKMRQTPDRYWKVIEINPETFKNIFPNQISERKGNSENSVKSNQEEKTSGGISETESTLNDFSEKVNQRTPSPKISTKIKEYKIGDTFSYKNPNNLNRNPWKLKIFGVEVKESISRHASQTLHPTTAQGKFILIDLWGKNIGDEKDSLSYCAFKLEDEEGRKFEYFSHIWNPGCLVCGVNPGFEEREYLIFDIPKDVQGKIVLLISEENNIIKVNLGKIPEIIENSSDEIVPKNRVVEMLTAMDNLQYEYLWDEMLHPDDQLYWESKTNYVQTFKNLCQLKSELGIKTLETKLKGSFKKLDYWEHKITHKQYKDVVEVPIEKRQLYKEKKEGLVEVELEETFVEFYYWQKVDGAWKYFTTADKKNIKQLIETYKEEKEREEMLLSPGYSRQNPASVNTPLTIEEESWNGNYKIKITLLETIRGDLSWKLIEEANMFNSPPETGSEYLLAKVKFEYLKGPTSDTTYHLYEEKFTAVSSNGKDYEDSWMISEPKPELSATLYEGASHIGWVAFQVAKTDSKPLMTFGRNYDGTGGIWFKLY